MVMMEGAGCEVVRAVGALRRAASRPRWRTKRAKQAGSSRLVAPEQSLGYRRVKRDVARAFEVGRPLRQTGELLPSVGERAGRVERFELGGEGRVGWGANWKASSQLPDYDTQTRP